SLEPLRKELLKAPLQFFRNLRDLLEADRDTRPESLALLASAYRALGYTTTEIGSEEDALEAYRQASAILELLVRDHPSVAAYRIHLAASHNGLGNRLRKTGRLDDAMLSYQRALTIQERLARDHPAVA